MIPLTHGISCTVSSEDVDLAAANWYADANNYAVRTVARHIIKMHRVIVERMLCRPLVPGEEVDHRDGNPQNNTRENLRVTSRQQNAWNQGRNKRNTSGYKGVSIKRARNPRKYWQANIRVNGRSHHLGYFATPEEASAAYQQAEAQYFGEFKRA